MSTIQVVVDPCFGERLAALPSEEPVWIVQSPLNTPVAQRLWQEGWGALTCFQPGGEASGESDLIQMLGTIDLHHGVSDSSLEVIGCLPSERVRAALAEFDLTVISVISEGFFAKRREVEK